MAEKNRNKGWSEYAGTLCHKKERTVRMFQDKCHKCVTRILVLSNTNVLCHHRNKEQSEYFDTNV